MSETFMPVETIFFCVLLLVILAVITMIDFASFRIPNVLNLLLAGSGIGWQFAKSSDHVVYQILFALGLLAVFYSVQTIHTRVTGKLGLGMGDVKMAGVAGMWISPFNFPIFIFIASLTGLVFGLVKLGFQSSAAIPFGPFLAFGLFSTWMWENFL